MPAPSPIDEGDRLAALYAYDILDSDPEEEFESIARLAAQICGTPVARINLVDRDRQWPLAVYGAERDEVDRDLAFCAHTIVEPGRELVVPDAREDRRFAHNPFVLEEPGIRFYAGAAVGSPEGHALGAVCVIDHKPRVLDEERLEALRILSRMTTTQLELRRRLADERRLVDDLQELERQRAEFTAAVAHDVRSPLTSIGGYAELIRGGHVEVEPGLVAIERNAERLLRLVDDLRGDAAPERGPVDLGALALAAVSLAEPAARAAGVTLAADVCAASVVGDAHRLAQVAENLVGNGVKYAPGGRVDVRVRLEDGDAVLEVADTGVGIPADELPRIFDRLFRASTSEGFAGTGIGLATVKSIVEDHGGRVAVKSTVGGGSTFRVVLPSGSRATMRA
jgi:signal transduction histidine kinase